MDVKKYDNDLVGVKLDNEERGVLGRAAQATVRAIGKETMDAAEAGPDTGATTAEAKAKANKTILAIGSVTKRITDNRPPVSFIQVDGGMAVEVGEEGYTVLDSDEVDTAQGFLQRYADTTVEAVESYTHQGGLNTSAWERAHYGQVAENMATQLRGMQPQAPAAQ